MKEFVKTICIALGLTGMLFSCSGHRVIEKTTFEIEETEVEDLLSRREDNERHANCPFQLTGRQPEHGLQQKFMHILKTLQSTKVPNERTNLNGVGAFLLI